jgi:hypothetical protein
VWVKDVLFICASKVSVGVGGGVLGYAWVEKVWVLWTRIKGLVFMAWRMCVHACVTSFIHASHTCKHPDREREREIGTHMHTVVSMSMGRSRLMFVAHVCYTCMYMGVGRE